MKIVRCLYCSIACLVIGVYSLVGYSATNRFTKTQSAFTDGKLHIYFCGTGVPDPGNQWLRHPSCLAVVYKKQFFLIDVGAGASLRLSQIGLPIYKISRIFMTHLHSDHMAGLGSVINESWIFGRHQQLPIYGPYGLKKVLNGIKQSYRPDVWFRSINRQGLLNPSLAFANAHIINLGQDGKKLVWHNDGLRITAYRVYHEPVFPAFGYMLQFQNCRIFVTGDTHVFNREADIAHHVDVMISEALSHPLQQQRLAAAKKMSQRRYEFWHQIDHYHSDTWLLAKVAAKAGVKHLFLTHLDPSIGTSTVDKAKFTAGMRKFYSGPIIVADDMDEVTVSNNNNAECQIDYIPHSQS